MSSARRSGLSVFDKNYEQSPRWADNNQKKNQRDGWVFGEGMTRGLLHDAWMRYGVIHLLQLGRSERRAQVAYVLAH